MAISTYNIPTDKFLFTDIDGLEWSAQSITLYCEDLGLTKVSIEMHTNAHGWVSLKDHKLFGYSADICGPIFGGGFNPSKPYHVTVELHSDHLTLLGILYDGEDVETWFHSDAVAPALQTPENFLLISTLQPINAKMQWGMTTKYSNSHHA